MNSYRRLWDTGFWAPVYADWGYQNRTCALRISAPGRFEYRSVDSTVNPYLMAAGILKSFDDGIRQKIDPGEPMDKNMYELPPEEHAKIPQVPGSLAEALDHLEQDHEFLLKGDVFTRDFMEMWISHKRKEHDALRLRPHPYEFFLYYDA